MYGIVTENLYQYTVLILTSKGLKPDPHKEQAIMDYETTKNVADVQRFFGPVSYLGKFMINLRIMNNPIHSLIHQNEGSGPKCLKKLL